VNFTFDVSLSEAGIIDSEPLPLVVDRLLNVVNNLILGFKSHLG
jgi:hypothetical protein